MSKSIVSRRPNFARGRLATTNKAPGEISDERSISALQRLGWKPFFQQQLTLEELNDCDPMRVMAVHRSQLNLAGAHGEESLPVAGVLFSEAPELRPTVGDWLLLQKADRKPVRRLERSSQFQRMAAGARQLQLIAANVDSVLIVSSCNQDFNLSRLERYLALVRDAGCQAYLVLTKVDQCGDPASFEQALRAYPELPVTLVNGLQAESLAHLRQWCRAGETLALLGSSGVGKSTLLNTLAGTDMAATAAIREDDSKGRHTTRHRALYSLDWGALLLDSPGMRELGLAETELGLAETFADIGSRAEHCRFADCRHQAEPGCAVRAALDSGELDERRLRNWQKLGRELDRNSKTLAEQRADSRQLGQYYKSVQSSARARKQRE